jgi:hypothetical protein
VQLLNVKKMKEGESVKDFDHVLVQNMVSISSQGRLRMLLYSAGHSSKSSSVIHWSFPPEKIYILGWKWV